MGRNAAAAHRHKATITPVRGEIFVCAFDPTVGHEIQKTRPALIVQNDIGNRYSAITIVAAITSSISPVPYPIEVIVEPGSATGLRVRSSIRLDQIRSVDKARLIRRLGKVDAATIAGVNRAIQISLGLVQL